MIVLRWIAVIALILVFLLVLAVVAPLHWLLERERKVWVS
jgi:hypothetical protein